MQIKNIQTIFRKELKDTLRDRRTLMFMLVFPIVLMPLLMTSISKLMIGQVQKMEAEKSAIVIKGFDQLPQDLQDTLKAEPLLSIETNPEVIGPKPVDSLKAGKFLAYVEVPDKFSDAIRLESKTDLTVYYDNAEDKSSVAVDKFKSVLDRYKKRVINARITSRTISTEVLEPFDIVKNDVASAQKFAGKRVGAFLPYLFIIMCFLGAMYPAVDLAAGEKERGTIETLLVAPATRGEFVMGKYFVIMLTGMIAGFCSMISMTYALNKMMKGLGQGAGAAMTIQLDVSSVFLIIMVVIPLAGIFAALLLSISVYSKSAKEAQGYMSIMNMALILPAFVAMVPGIKLDAALALIPISSTSLIIKDAISGIINWEFVLISFASSFIVAIAALFFAKKWFEREEVLFRV